MLYQWTGQQNKWEPCSDCGWIGVHAVTALGYICSPEYNSYLFQSTNCVITVDEGTYKHWCAALSISLTFKHVYRCLSLWGCVCRQCPWRSEEYTNPRRWSLVWVLGRGLLWKNSMLSVAIELVFLQSERDLLMSSTWIVFPLLFSMGIGLYSPPYDLAYSMVHVCQTSLHVWLSKTILIDSRHLAHFSHPSLSPLQTNISELCMIAVLWALLPVWPVTTIW